MSQGNKVYYPLLDVLRGPAALLVFLEHWRNLFFKDFPEIANPGILMKVFYLFTGAGHQAVMLFFVLSGCVIAHVIYGLHERGKWSWRGYLSARLSRLWIVLIPALGAHGGVGLDRYVARCWQTIDLRGSGVREHSQSTGGCALEPRGVFRQCVFSSAYFGADIWLQWTGVVDFL
jgi:hypothetical protein